MQYGNKERRTSGLRTSGEFKSYYVVWKQQEWKEIDDGKDEFKSYYVVWKRNSDTTHAPNFIQFKSYYVVWKLSKRGRTQQLPPDGLNRTMQYGNIFLDFLR